SSAAKLPLICAPADASSPSSSSSSSSSAPPPAANPSLICAPAPSSSAPPCTSGSSTTPSGASASPAKVTLSPYLFGSALASNHFLASTRNLSRCQSSLPPSAISMSSSAMT